MTNFKTWAAESIKFAVTVFVFLILQSTWTDFTGLGADAIVQVVIALFAGFVTMIVTDVVFGRPVLHLTWQESRTAISGRHPLRLSAGERTLIRCELRLEGKTVVSWLLERITRRCILACEVTFFPDHPARYVVEWPTPSADISISANKLTFNFPNGIPQGHLEVVDIRVTARDDPPAPVPVNCRVVMKTPTKFRFVYRIFLKVENDLQGFLVGR